MAPEDNDFVFIDPRADIRAIGSKAVICAACFVAIVWLGGLVYPLANPSAREGRQLFEDLAAQSIVSISIEPAERYSMISTPVVVTDKKTISEFANALSGLLTHVPSHPHVTRAVVLRIQLQDRVIGGVLKESSNNGTTFYYMSEITTGWVFAKYYVHERREIFKLLERVLSERFHT